MWIKYKHLRKLCFAEKLIFLKRPRISNTDVVLSDARFSLTFSRLSVNRRVLKDDLFEK